MTNPQMRPSHAGVRRRWTPLGAVAGALAVFLTSACAGSGARPRVEPTPAPAPRGATTAGRAAASLEARAESYWQRRAAKDLAGAYPFYCAAYRARVSQAEFLQMTRLTRFDLRDVRVGGATEAGGRATVRVLYRFMMPTITGEPLDGESTDAWIRGTDGQWCKEDEPLLLPFPGAPEGVAPPLVPASPGR